MRRIFGVLLIGVGVFAAALAILSPTYGVSHAKKTPLDLNITQISSGPAKLFDATTGQIKDVRLRATRKVATDSAASDGTNTTVNESLCIVIIEGATPNCVASTDPRLLSVTTDRVTTNRKTAEAVHVAKWNENVNGDTTVRHQGMAYSFPIGTKKQDYLFFLPDLKKAFPAKYAGTSTIRGLKVYKFVSATGPQPYKVQGLFDGTYNDTRTVWIEPRTGVIVDGTERQVQSIGSQVVLDTTLSFEKSAIDYQSHYAKQKIKKLQQAQLWIPIIGGIIAAGAFVGAFFLLRRRPAAEGPGGPGHEEGGGGPNGGGGPGGDVYDTGPQLTGSSSQT